MTRWPESQDEASGGEPTSQQPGGLAGAEREPFLGEPAGGQAGQLEGGSPPATDSDQSKALPRQEAAARVWI